jgi:hypothetical protein
MRVRSQLTGHRLMPAMHTVEVADRDESAAIRVRTLKAELQFHEAIVRRCERL